METAVLIFYDGVCDSTREIETLTGYMEDKWVLSSSGRHMFISFIPYHYSHPGFSAKIHHGIKLIQKPLY